MWECVHCTFCNPPLWLVCGNCRRKVDDVEEEVDRKQSATNEVICLDSDDDENGVDSVPLPTTKTAPTASMSTTSGAHVGITKDALIELVEGLPRVHRSTQTNMANATKLCKACNNVYTGKECVDCYTYISKAVQGISDLPQDTKTSLPIVADNTDTTYLVQTSTTGGKFWKIEHNGCNTTVTFGSINNSENPHPKKKTHPTFGEASNYYDKAIRNKISKGYYRPAEKTVSVNEIGAVSTTRKRVRSAEANIQLSGMVESSSGLNQNEMPRGVYQLANCHQNPKTVVVPQNKVIDNQYFKWMIDKLPSYRKQLPENLPDNAKICIYGGSTIEPGQRLRVHCAPNVSDIFANGITGGRVGYVQSCYSYFRFPLGSTNTHASIGEQAWVTCLENQLANDEIIWNLNEAGANASLDAEFGVYYYLFWFVALKLDDRHFPYRGKYRRKLAADRIDKFSLSDDNYVEIVCRFCWCPRTVLKKQALKENDTLKPDQYLVCQQSHALVGYQSVICNGKKHGRWALFDKTTKPNPVNGYLTHVFEKAENMLCSACQGSCGKSGRFRYACTDENCAAKKIKARKKIHIPEHTKNKIKKHKPRNWATFGTFFCNDCMAEHYEEHGLPLEPALIINNRNNSNNRNV